MSSNLGLGVMIQMLGGNEESVAAFKRGLNKVITNAELVDDALLLTFEDGYKLRLVDEGQSCCESRYMTTDDDLSIYVGAELLGAEISPVEQAEGFAPAYDDEHDVAFLRVQTSKGMIVVANHNEHNGYYGGFWIVAKAEEAQP